MIISKLEINKVINDFTDEYNRLIREARAQIEQQCYEEAINNLDRAIQNNETDGYAFFLRGKAYSQLKKYKIALTNYETALSKVGIAHPTFFCEIDLIYLSLSVAYFKYYFFVNI